MLCVCSISTSDCSVDANERVGEPSCSLDQHPWYLSRQVAILHFTPSAAFFFLLDANEQKLFITDRSCDFFSSCSDRSQFFVSLFCWFLTDLFFHSRTRTGFSYINMTRRGGGQEIFSTDYNSNTLHPLLTIQTWWQKCSGFTSFFVSLRHSLASWQKSAP